MDEVTEQELHYLRWMYEDLDFDPATDDLICVMKEKYTEETGRPVPEGYGKYD